MFKCNLFWLFFLISRKTRKNFGNVRSNPLFLSINIFLPICIHFLPFLQFFLSLFIHSHPCSLLKSSLSSLILPLSSLFSVYLFALSPYLLIHTLQTHILSSLTLLPSSLSTHNRLLSLSSTFNFLSVSIHT